LLALAATLCVAGVDAGATVAYSRVSALYDDEGDRTELPAALDDSAVLVRLDLGWAFELGLFAGIEVPLVSRVINDSVGSATGRGVGDVSGALAYRYELVPGVFLGARVRGKLPTGRAGLELGPDEAPTGSGNADAGGELLASAVLGDFLAEGQVGYLARLPERVDDVTTRDPGDFVHADVAVGWRVSELLAPSVRLVWAQQGESVETIADASDRSRGAGWLAVALEVDVTVNEMLGASVGFGGPLDAYGLGLRSGWVLAGASTASLLGAHAAVRLEL
jgi:hypothetical protein